MKRKTILYSAMVLGAILISYDGITFVGGADPGHSGSPQSNGSTCMSCHIGGPSVTTQTIAVTSDIPASGFEPNTDYTITVTATSGATSSSRIGFEASVEDANGHAGTLTTGGNGAIQNKGSFITHRSSGTTTSSGTKSWDMQWNSGNATGDVTVYVAANFTNNNGNTSGDVILTSQQVLTKATNIGFEEKQVVSLELFPNPAQNFVEVKGLSKKIKSVSLYNLSGQMLTSFAVDHTSDVFTIDVSGIVSGTYLLRADSEDKYISTQKLIISK